MNTGPAVAIRRGTSRNRLHRAWLRLNFALRTCRCPRCAPTVTETPASRRCQLRPAGYLDMQARGLGRIRFWVCPACEDHALVYLTWRTAQAMSTGIRRSRPSPPVGG